MWHNAPVQGQECLTSRVASDRVNALHQCGSSRDPLRHVGRPIRGWKRAMRILGLDVGSKTIGMAVSDELELVANTLSTLQRKGMEQDLRNLAAVIDEQEVGAI